MGRQAAICVMGVLHDARRSTGETPFSMMYGSEVVIPLEKGFPTMRFDQFDSSSNERLLSTSLDLAKERREVAIVKLAQYQQKQARI